MPGLVRLRILGFCVLCAFLILAGRLWWLQLSRWSEYAAKALGNRLSVVYEAAPRGLILDRAGRRLAENRDVWNLSVVPADIPKNKALLEKEIAFIASVLSTPTQAVSTAQVRAALTAAKGSLAAKSLPLANLGQDLSFGQVALIEEHQMDFPGLNVTTTTRRHYPYGIVAAQAVGYARGSKGAPGEQSKDLQFPPDPSDPTLQVGANSVDAVYCPDSIVGEEGAEALCELDTSVSPAAPILPGRRGRVVYEVDATGTPQRLLAERPPVPGATVALTLDAQWQFVAQKALREAIALKPGGSGAVVVMDVRNGDVLVLASEPCLDPNDWVGGMSGPLWEQARLSPGLPLINKAIAGRYPPGSVFKAVSVCAAYETAHVTESSTSFCSGRITVGRRHETFKCWMAGRGGHGSVDLLHAIAWSCNIFFYDCVLSRGLQAEQIARYSRDFGLGEPTGIGLPGEASGNVPSPEFSVNDTGHPWQTGNSLNFVIGQDRLTVTPLQMCAVAAAVANGGDLYKPNLIRQIRWPAYLHRPDTINTVGKGRRLRVRPQTLAMVRRGMRLAVTDNHGTAHYLRTFAFTSAGKTGSAQHTGGEKTHAWYIGFAPAEAPRYAIAVFLAEGGTGGENAVPVGARVLSAIFGQYITGNPLFTLPPPMEPEQVADQRRLRLALAQKAHDERVAEGGTPPTRPAPSRPAQPKTAQPKAAQSKASLGNGGPPAGKRSGR